MVFGVRRGGRPPARRAERLAGTVNTATRPIPDFAELFARADGVILRRTARGLRQRKTRLHKGGVYVRIKRDGRTYEPSVGHLVLTAFVGPCPGGHQAGHLDGNPLNNRLTNLAWTPRRRRAAAKRKAKKKHRRA
jgi:hypothetical protein